MDPDHALLTRLRDLAATLPGDVAWLAGPFLAPTGCATSASASPASART